MQTSESRYTDEVKRIFRGMKPPYHGFIVDIVEHDQYNYLELRVYRPNIEEFSDPQKVLLAEYLYKLRDAIRSTGVNCHIQGAESSPPNRRGVAD